MTIKNSIALLKPKANKLLNLMTNWKYFSKEEKIELATNIEKLANDRSYPKPIEIFFELPSFRELMKNMKEGRLLSKPVGKDQECSYHPPIEIQNLQVLVESFHKLVHLDFQENLSKDPFTRAKVYGANILDYLSMIDALIPYSGDLITEILDHLLSAVQNFSKSFQDTISHYPSSFSKELLDLSSSSLMSDLGSLSYKNYHGDLIKKWLTALSYLNIDAKISTESQKIKTLARFNMHKLINQMSTLLATKRDFYQRNAPFYKPYELENAMKELIEKSVDRSNKISGQKINELFCQFFWQRRYEIVSAKQEGIHKKLKMLGNELSIVRESIKHLLKQYQFFLPKQFTFYAENFIAPIGPAIDYLSRPNFLACSALLGFGSVQTDYLIELLADPTEYKPPHELGEKISSILPMLFSFTQQYYHTYPLTSFSFIRSYYESFISSDELENLFSAEDAISRIQDSLSLFLPQETSTPESLESAFHTILHKCKDCLSMLDPHTPEAKLLSERLNFASYADLPSSAEVWFIIGELTGLFYLLLAKIDESFYEKLFGYRKKLFSKKFIQLLFFSINE